MTTPQTARPVFVFAPGAGAPSTHQWMQAWKERLETLGAVHDFDYSYMIEGSKRPDPLPRLIAAHRAALQAARRQYGGPIFLMGKSMGGRIGCHLALEETVSGLICLGYPLCGGGDCTKLRDKVLLALSAPVLFVQGSRDQLCPLDVLEGVRAKMQAPTTLLRVEGGNHSLLVTKTALKRAGESQDAVDARILEAVRAFVANPGLCWAIGSRTGDSGSTNRTPSGGPASISASVTKRIWKPSSSS